MLYISARDHLWKLKFNSYVSIMLRLSNSVQYIWGYSFEHGCYISALEHIRMLILNSYVLLACINTIYKHGQAYVI